MHTWLFSFFYSVAKLALVDHVARCKKLWLNNLDLTGQRSKVRGLDQHLNWCEFKLLCYSQFFFPNCSSTKLWSTTVHYWKFTLLIKKTHYFLHVNFSSGITFEAKSRTPQNSPQFGEYHTFFSGLHLSSVQIASIQATTRMKKKNVWTKFV